MAIKKDILFKNATYVDIKRHWRRLRPVFASDKARAIWEPCMMEFAQWRAEERGYTYKPYDDGSKPERYDSCDWRWSGERRGRMPAYWDYACYSACHWVVDLGLFVAQSYAKSEEWRIITSQKHSTVWNGDCQKPLLFDINFSALGVSAQDALTLAAKGRELKVGRYLKGYLHGTEAAN